MAASYGAPGVYVEEKPSGSMPLQGVGTAVASFVGFTEMYDAENGDPTDPGGVRPQLVTNWPQYERVYGGCPPGIMLPLAVRGFFENGGSLCYIVRIPTAGGDARRGLPAVGRPELDTIVVEPLRTDGAYSVEVVAPPAGAEPTPDFTVRVLRDGVAVEEHDGLSVGKGAKAVDKVLNEESKLVRVQVKNAVGLSQAERAPAPGRYDLTPSGPSAVGVTAVALEGNELDRTGYKGLAIADDVTIVAMPDLVTVTTAEDGTFDEEMYLAAQGRLVDWCEQTGTRMAILDAPPRLNAIQAGEWRERLGKDSGYGAAYYPHLVVVNPRPPAGATNGDKFRVVPPCGHVAGVWARTDAARGVWKAPANEVLRGVVRLENDVTTGEQEKLNPNQVNCIRSFGAGGIRVWGARTLARNDQSWRYINVRRLFIFMEETVRRGTQWVVFEPNDQDLWARVRRTVSAFLHGLWMQGALVGGTPEQAFYVQCDESNNPRAQRDNGLLVVDIGIAPVRPAEFVVFRVSQWQGGAAGE